MAVRSRQPEGLGLRASGFGPGAATAQGLGLRASGFGPSRAAGCVAVMFGLLACAGREPRAKAEKDASPSTGVAALGRSPKPEARGPSDPARGPDVRVPDRTTQLLVGVTDGWDATDATLRLWRRDDAASAWQPVGETWPAVVGRAGVAWGRGLHGDRPPAGQDGAVKREGDGRSPAGLFAIGAAWGYDAAPPAGTRVPYTMATDAWRCVDDPASAHYTRLLDERTVTIDWASREELRRDDELYRWIVLVDHNPDATPGAGSCIFLHVWDGPGSSTSGCTAMEEPRLAALLARLDPAAHPAFVLLPRAAYAALATAWTLPALPAR